MKPKRKPRPITVPTMVALYNHPQIEIEERMAVNAFTGGWAAVRHFDILADVRDLLTLAAAHKGDAEVLALCEAGCIALQNIADRYRATDRMGASGEEAKAVAVLVDVSNDWWKLQSGTLYRDANRALDKARKFERERTAA